MTEDISLREAFGLALVKLGKQRSDFVVFDADVAGGTGVYHFRDAFPERFFQCGIAEQNMMAAAAGFSTLGVIPIVTTYAVFASMRAIEQARQSIAYPRFNVKIVASHGGLDVGPDGATHQGIEDLAIYRAIPNMTVVVPGDPFEVEKALAAILDYHGPVYMRTGRSPVPYLFNENYKFRLGRGKVIREGDDITIIAIGTMLHRALETAELLKADGVSGRVVNMSTLKPIDRKLIIESARKTGAIVTAEDHNIIGGLGSAVSEVLAQNEPVPVEMVGIKDTFGESAEPWELAKKYKLTAEDIARAARSALRRKIKCVSKTELP